MSESVTRGESVEESNDGPYGEWEESCDGWGAREVARGMCGVVQVWFGRTQ